MPRLQRAFVAMYGAERGHEATAEALGYAWEHWSRLRRMENPTGYAFRVGQSRTRPRRRTESIADWPATSRDVLVEPGLGDALRALSPMQRATVVLVHGYEWTLREVAGLLDVSVSTVQTHCERGMERLRGALEVVDDA
jgi:DNA-directed RNA polymerase specialized sigma24 family protein